LYPYRPYWGGSQFHDRPRQGILARFDHHHVPLGRSVLTQNLAGAALRSNTFSPSHTAFTQARRPAPRKQRRKRGSPDQKCAQEHRIGPARCASRSVSTLRSSSFCSVRGQQRRQGEQPGRGVGGPFPDEGKGVPEAPEGVGEFGMDEKDFHIDPRDAPKRNR